MTYILAIIILLGMHMGQLIQLKEENRDFDFYLNKLKELSGNDFI